MGFQFTAKMQYSGAATNSVEARQKAEIRALQNTARYSVERETTRADLAEALANIERALPAASKEHGKQEAAAFLAARYGLGNGDIPPANLAALMEALNELLEDEEAEPIRPFAMSSNGQP